MRTALIVLALALSVGCGIAPEVVEARQEAEQVQARIEGRGAAIAETVAAVQAGDMPLAEALALLQPWYAESRADAERLRELAAVMDGTGTPWWYYGLLGASALAGIAGTYYPIAKPLAVMLGSVIDGVEAGGDAKTKAAISTAAKADGVGGRLKTLVDKRT